MMTDLFSTFDPATTILNLPLNWLSVMISFMIIPSLFWMINNNYSIFFIKGLMLLNKEFKVNINNNMKNMSMIIFSSIFTMIMFNNLLGLFPYIFTSTSHLLMNLTLALPLWMSLIIYGWTNNSQHMFTHLVPQGTPEILIPFMVMIETISNIIRPITLTVRLTANMIAGHLLLTLLGNIGPTINISTMSILLLITQLLLLMLETAVTIIQAYVFATLMTLYFSEI